MLAFTRLEESCLWWHNKMLLTAAVTLDLIALDVLTVTYAIYVAIRIAAAWWCQQKQLQVLTSLSKNPFHPLGFCCATADCFYLVSSFIAEKKNVAEKCWTNEN